MSSEPHTTLCSSPTRACELSLGATQPRANSDRRDVTRRADAHAGTTLTARTPRARARVDAVEVEAVVELPASILASIPRSLRAVTSTSWFAASAILSVGAMRNNLAAALAAAPYRVRDASTQSYSGVGSGFTAAVANTRVVMLVQSTSTSTEVYGAFALCKWPATAGTGSTSTACLFTVTTGGTVTLFPITAAGASSALSYASSTSYQYGTTDLVFAVGGSSTTATAVQASYGPSTPGGSVYFSPASPFTVAAMEAYVAT